MQKLIFNKRKNASTPKYANTIKFVFSWPSTAGPELTLYIYWVLFIYLVLYFKYYIKNKYAC